MSDSTTPVPQVTAGSGAVVRTNELFDAASPAILYGRNGATTTGLTWGYIGGRLNGTSVANGTVALTASNTNYVVAKISDGVVSASTATTNWNDTAQYVKLYLIVAGASSITSYQDWRGALGGGGGAGLTNFTEAANSASPNATVPVVSLAATNAAANVDLALLPKGTGALLADVPDSATAGGNKRGTYAVDWQVLRTAATQVASGIHAVISGGYACTSSGQYSSVGGGIGSNASGNTSTVAGGSGNAASTTSATVSGGTSNTASGANSSIGGGESNAASSSHAAIPGGRSNVANGIYSIAMGYLASSRGRNGGWASACGSFSTAGQAQTMRLVYYTITTNATPGLLLSQDTVAGLTNYYVLENNMSIVFRARVIACQHTTGDTAAFEIRGCIKRRATAGTTALVGTPSVTVIAADAGAAAWTCSATADTTNGVLQINVTGEAAKTIRWVSEIEAVELVSG